MSKTDCITHPKNINKKADDIMVMEFALISKCLVNLIKMDHSMI